MAGYSSRHGTIAIAKQTAKGSAAANPTVKFQAAGQPSLAPAKGRARYAMTDGGRDRGAGYTSGLSVAGDVPLYLHFDGFALLAYLALGSNADSGAGPDYTHTATPANDLPYCTIWRMVAGVVLEKYVDCKVGSLRLEGQAGQPWQVTLGVVGISSEFEASDTVLAALTSPGLLYPEAKDLIKIDTVAQRIHRVTWEVTNGLDGYQADDYFFADINPGGREVNFSFSTLFQGTTAFPKYREFFYGSDSGTTLSPVVGTHAVDVAIQRAANKSVQLTMPQVTYSAVPVQMDPGGAPIQVEVACEVEDPSGSAICTVVTKDQAATV